MSEFGGAKINTLFLIFLKKDFVMELVSAGYNVRVNLSTDYKLHVMCETSCQSRFDARCWMLGAGALGRPRGMEWGGRTEEGSGWGTHVYLWWIHFDIWQN